MHATLVVDGQELAGADVPHEVYVTPRGSYVLLAVDGVEEARRIFDALGEGGEVKLALQETFWSPAFGVLVDRFGIPWEISAS